MKENAFTRKKKQGFAQQRAASSLDELTISNNDTVQNVTQGQVFELPTSFFYPDPDQVRKEFDEHSIFELSESFRLQKQIQPIIVHPKDDNGRYKIDKGERRWRAAQLIEGFQLKAVIDEDAAKRSDLKRLSGQFAENDQRKDLAPWESALALQKYLSFGLSMEEAAIEASYFVRDTKRPNITKVGRTLSILKLPEEGQALVKEKIVVDLITLEFLRKINDVSSKKFSTLCDIARQEGGLSRARAEQEYKQCKRNGVEASNTDNTPPANAAPHPSALNTVAAQSLNNSKEPAANLQPDLHNKAVIKYPKINVVWQDGQDAEILFDHHATPKAGHVYIRLNSGDVILSELRELTLTAIEI